MEKVKVLTALGEYISLEEWQKRYGITGDNIGRHFSLSEHRFQKDIELFGELIVCAPLMIIMDAYREEKGSSITVNSYNRSHEKQQQLIADGFRAAKTSPHEFKLAADCDTKTYDQSRKEGKMVIEIGKKLKIPCRVGIEDYIKEGQTFIHIDVCPLYFGKGGVWAKQAHPKPWEKAYSTW